MVNPAQKLMKGLKYFLRNPKYFMLYFLGKPEEVFTKISGKSSAIFMNFKKTLNRDSSFLTALNEKSSSVIKQKFRLCQDHYFLYAIVRALKPRLILETGVFDGSFTIFFLKGLEANYQEHGIDGKLISIDLPSYTTIAESTSQMKRSCLPPNQKPGWLIPDNLRNRWQLRLGDSLQLLPIVLEEIDNIDIFLHDSLHTYSHMKFEYETVWPCIKKHGILMSHDIHWNKAFREFVKKHGLKEEAFHGFGVVRK